MYQGTRRLAARLATLIIAASSVAVFSTPLSASAASGGGCRDVGNIRSCISFRSGTTNPLLGDFYVIGHGNESRGCLTLNIRGFPFEGNCYPLAYHGHYGPKSQTISGTGNAFTSVRVYDSGGVYLYTADSWVQYW
jgi:hypothetical protein